MIEQIINHLWQSTLFLAGVALLTMCFGRSRAQVRYWLWLAASVKFLFPFSLLVSIGGLFEWQAAPQVAPGGILAIHDLFPDPNEGGQAPIEIYRRAVASGDFEELPTTKTLGVLRRR